MTAIADEASLDQRRFKSGLSLLFAAGERPSADAVDAVLREAGDGLPGAMISHRSPMPEGWVELLASGLTFELHGLAPAAPAPVASPANLYGFGSAGDSALAGCEAAALITGPHLAGGSAMMPVVRTITGLAANLVLSLPVRAVCWQPAACWMEPRYFARAIIAWLAGGPFLALGLTAIEHDADGFVCSRGLDFFSGQDVRVAMRPGETPGETVKLAIRVIDNIVRGGPIARRTELDAVSGVALIAEPSADGRLVTVWRGR